MASCRTPPRKPNPRTPKGFCVWCGAKCEGRRRSWCSDKCVDEYRIANFAGAAQKAAWERDEGKCASCGSTPESRRQWRARRNQWKRYPPPEYEAGTLVTWIENVDPGWNADHIIPLWSVDRAAPDAFRFWRIENIATLCEPCHKAKTKAEAAQRAALKRPQKELALGCAI